MASETHDIGRDRFMLTGRLARKGYDWWWHSFAGRSVLTGEERSFFVEFFACNPALGGQAPILGQLAENRRVGLRPSYVMVKAGCWGEGARQLHRFFAWDEVELGRGVPFWVAADDCVCCETDLVGRVEVSSAETEAHPEWMSDVGSMLFDLRVDKQIAFNVGWGASAPLRALGAFEMMWHAEGIKTAYSGMVVLDGETFVVEPESCWGYSDKNWGSDFTSPWVWLSSCNLVSMRTGGRLSRSALEIGGGRPVVAGHALERQLLGCLNYEGISYEFNFSKPWTRPSTTFDCQESNSSVRWHIDQHTRSARLVTDVVCPKREMLLISYESPDGERRHTRLWNGGTGRGRVMLYERRRGSYELVDEIRARNVGCEYGVYASSS